MKALEDELDTILFIRGKRRLQLTDSGKLLYRHAKEILSLVGKTKEEIRAMDKEMRGKIAIGLVEGSAPIIAVEWIERFVAQYKNVEFHVGVQYHPEFKSRPNKPHPLFLGFVSASFNRALERY